MGFTRGEITDKGKKMRQSLYFSQTLIHLRLLSGLGVYYHYET